MRVVMAPLISFRNVQSESDYIYYHQLLEEWLPKNPNLYVHFILPERARASVRPMDRVNYIYDGGEGMELFYDAQVTLPRTLLQMFNPRGSRYIADAVVTSRTAAVPTWSRMLWDYRMVKPSIPILIIEAKVAAAGGSHQVIRHIETLSRSLGYACGYPIFLTPEERSLAMKTAARYLSGMTLGEIDKRSIVIPGGIKTGELDQIKAATPKRKKFTAFFGGRLNAMSKKADVMLELLDALFTFGRDVDIVVCSPKADKYFDEHHVKERYDHVEFHTRVPRPEFLKLACSCHVYLNTSQHEGFTVGFVEQMYAGLVSIIPDKPWVRAMLAEKFDEYPFVYRTWKEAAAMLTYVYGHLEEAQAQVAWVPEWLRSRYDQALISEMYLSRVQELVAEHASCGKGLLGRNITELFRGALGEMKARESRTFQLTDFWRAAQSLAEGQIPPDDSRWGRPSRWVGYKWLTAQGLVDNCKQPEPECTLAADAMEVGT